MPGGAHGHLATRAHHGEPAPVPAAADVPSKRDLTSWWRNFKKTSMKREEQKVPIPPPEQSPGIFGVPLQQSIRYANVAISLYNNDGESYIYGYVPIVVAKCGVFLKEKATDVEGIFRLSGSEKRIKELKSAFDSPDRFGKGLDWTGYTVHDAANILRRYFNMLPEPIIPLEFYDRFRAPIQGHQLQAVGPMDDQNTADGDFNVEQAIRTYQSLITELPPLNRQLLLYILDLLAVFASKSDLNKMTTANLAAIFQPGTLSHPAHDMSPMEYRLSQDVLIFLIDNQDHFLIGMQGTAADQQTVDEVQSGQTTPQAKTPTSTANKSGIGRSSSTASAGADSVRKYGGVRRNVSVSSRRSKASVANSPIAPSFINVGTNSIGVHRSNTVPSKKSPGVHATTFAVEKTTEPSTPTPDSIKLGSPLAQAGVAVQAAPKESRNKQANAAVIPTSAIPAIDSEASIPPPQLQHQNPGNKAPLSGSLPDAPTTPTKQRPIIQDAVSPPIDTQTPGSESPAPGGRSLTTLFSRASPLEVDKRDGRRPNKLQKKRNPSMNRSAHSSTHSLSGGFPASDGPPSPLPSGFVPAIPTQTKEELEPSSSPPKASGSGLKPSMSPSPSYRSHSTIEFSESEETPTGEEPDKEKRGSRWRISRLARVEKRNSPTSPSRNKATVGSIADAQQSTASVSSIPRGRKSVSAEQPQQSSMVPPTPSLPAESSSQAVESTSGPIPISAPVSAPGPPPVVTSDLPNQASTEPIAPSSAIDSTTKEPEKRGPINWFREKLQERKERAKSPPSTRSNGPNASVGSLGLAIESEAPPTRGKSMDVPRGARVEEGRRRESSDNSTPTPTIRHK